MSANASSNLLEVNEMDREGLVNNTFASMKCQRVKADESFVPALDNETIRVQHLFAEPRPGNASVDGPLCFGKENSWKHLDIDDFSYGFEYGLKGGLDCNNSQGHDELELGVLDGLLDEVEDVDDIHALDDISGACEDFILDVELAEKVSDLGCAPHGRLLLGNSRSESQSPGFSGNSNFALGLSESSTATIPESEDKNVSRKRTVQCELNDSSEDKWECEAGENVFTTHDLEEVDEVENTKLLESGISSDENEKKIVQAGKMGTLLRQKRTRRPTKRLIDEFSVPKFKHAMEGQNILAAASKDEHLTIISHNELHIACVPKNETLSETVTQETFDDDEKLSDLKSKCLTGKRKVSLFASKDNRLKIGSKNELHNVRGWKSALKEESFSESSTLSLFESRPRRGRPKKLPSVSVLESDDESSASDSEDDYTKRRSKKSNDRRKHQRMWTLSEVTKLIDGIAQYGTGRWTDIKKLFFSSSAYRTPIDLRDKWRNLLRATSVQKQKLKQNKKEAEEKLNHAIRPLPKTMIRRIHELATLHPYPRFTPGGRYIRRKN